MEIKVAKLTLAGLERYPMYVEPTVKEILNGLDSMLDGALDDLDNYPDVVATIRIVSVDKGWFDGLKPWEP